MKYWVQLAVLVMSSVVPVGAFCSSFGEVTAEGIESEYDGTAHVGFEVVNTGTETIFVDIVAQQLMNGVWADVTYSISKDHPGKVSILTELAPGARAKRVWDEVELPIEPGKYRFRFELVKLDTSKPYGTTHSEVFVVRPSATP
jgi:hypothetical protein